MSRSGETMGSDDHTTKLTPLATRTTELTFFVPPAQGTTHYPEEPFTVGKVWTDSSVQNFS